MKLWQKLLTAGLISAATSVPSCAIQKNFEESLARGRSPRMVSRDWNSQSGPRYLPSSRQYQNRQTINRQVGDRVNLNPDLWYMVPLAAFALSGALVMRYHEPEQRTS